MSAAPATDPPLAPRSADRFPARRLRRRLPSASVERYVEVSGYRIRIAVRPGSEPQTTRPLLLVSGIGASLELFEPFVETLGPERDVIRFDVPGVGGSPVPPAPLTMSMLASLVAGLLDELGHRLADILGISWGGGVAQQFALQHPSRCGRLVLASSGTGVLMVPARPSVLAKMLTPRRYHDPKFRRREGAEIYQGEDPDVVDQLFSTLWPVRTRGYLYQVLAVATWTSLPFLPLLPQPTLVVNGDDDPVVPLVNGRLLAGMLSGGRLHVHPGGHLGLVSRPHEFSSLVEDFLDGRS